MYGSGAAEYLDIQGQRVGGGADAGPSETDVGLAEECGTAVGGYRDRGGEGGADGTELFDAISKSLKQLLIRINPRETEGPAGTISPARGAAEGLEMIRVAMVGG